MIFPKLYRRKKQRLQLLFLNLMPFSQVAFPFPNNVLNWTDHWKGIDRTPASATLRDRNHLEQSCFDRQRPGWKVSTRQSCFHDANDLEDFPKAILKMQVTYKLYENGNNNAFYCHSTLDFSKHLHRIVSIVA